MKIIVPITITDAIFNSSNVTEDDYTAWNSGTSYVVGNRCILVSTHKIYECLINNSNSSPDVNLTGLTPKWLEIGSTNKWKMIDSQWGTQTVNSSSIVVEMEPGQTFNSLALMNLDAYTAHVQMTSSGVVVYDYDVPLLAGKPILDWYDYFFAATLWKTEVVLQDIPQYSDGIITVTLTKTGGNAACGNFVLGNYYYLGGTQYNANIGIIDYSVKNTDAFGNPIIVARKFSKRMTVKTIIKNYLVDDAALTLARYRTTALVWVGEDENQFASLIVYGYYRSFDIDIAFIEDSYMNLEIEGLS
jgi:hypothetical protein